LARVLGYDSVFLLFEELLPILGDWPVVSRAIHLAGIVGIAVDILHGANLAADDIADANLVQNQKLHGISSFLSNSAGVITFNARTLTAATMGSSLCVCC